MYTPIGQVYVETNITVEGNRLGKLEKRVWSYRRITTNTKLSVYEACILTVLLYGSETWTPYRQHVNLLESFRHNCIRRILNIEWRSYTPDIVVLERKSRIEQRPILNQICWVGHVVRMGDGRLSKQLFYGELTRGKRPQHKPRKRFNPIRPEEGGSDNLR